MFESRNIELYINLLNNVGLFFMCLNMKRRQLQSKSVREKERDNERQISKLNEKNIQWIMYVIVCYLVNLICLKDLWMMLMFSRLVSNIERTMLFSFIYFSQQRLDVMESSFEWWEFVDSVLVLFFGMFFVAVIIGWFFVMFFLEFIVFGI